MTMIWYGLAADLVAVVLLAYVLYFRRHRRRDLLLAYIALNVGIFAVVVLMLNQQVDLAVGFGLFGVLSIIRLRSDSITQEEIGYYFVALAMGLVNGIAASMPLVMIGLNVLLLATMWLADHPRLGARIQHRLITLDVVHSDPDRLRLDLESRIGGRVLRSIVTEVDYVRDVMVVDVRFRSSR